MVEGGCASWWKKVKIWIFTPRRREEGFTFAVTFASNVDWTVESGGCFPGNGFATFQFWLWTDELILD